MPNNKEFVKFEKVDKSYDGKVLVVKDLNLNISEGEFVTMLGPSGSGKTTCLMMLAGFETPTNGEIYLDNNPISTYDSLRKSSFSIACKKNIKRGN
jgi:putative spermidine/putrescine transport system ATP-binding protein